MFRDVIQETALTTSDADDYFGQKIWGDRVRDDSTFVSTLRALLGNRIPEGECLQFVYQRSAKNESFYTGTDGYAVKSTVGFYDESDIGWGKLYYHRCEHSDQAANNAALEFIEKHFIETFDGFQRVQKVTDFFIKRSKILCFVNPEKKTVFLFSGVINMRIFHYIQCGIYAMFPWYFDPEERPTSLEMAVITGLRQENSSDYRLAIKNIAATLNFREMKIRNLLNGFESNTYRHELDRVANDINNCRDQISELFRKARELQGKKREYETKSLGLMARIADSSAISEYMEYFLSNQSLTLIGCSGMTVEIVARGYIEFFDEDIAKSLIDNKTGIMYRPNGDSMERYYSVADMKKLLTAVFLEHTIKMRVCSYYKLTTDGVYVHCGYRFSDEFSDCTPNPHIDQYHCLGDYEEAINTLLSEGDYVGATEQCIASCQSLNFADYPVMKEFARRLYGTTGVNMNCFELPDGEVVDQNGAIAWLKEHEQTTETTSEESETEEVQEG